MPETFSPSACAPVLDEIWTKLREGAERMATQEPLLENFTRKILLKGRKLTDALAHLLADELGNATISSLELLRLFQTCYAEDPFFALAASDDLDAILKRDPAAHDPLIPFLYFKGFHAIQTHRIAHDLWNKGRKDLAYYLQSRCSVLFGVDIHPAARLGRRLMFDHATGIVIGETSVIEDDVSLLHGVTLGGTGKETGDRHPKIRRGVMIGAGSSVLGNIEIGTGSSIAAGSVVLNDVPPHVSVAGVPAKIIGKPKTETPATEMDQRLPEV